MSAFNKWTAFDVQRHNLRVAGQLGRDHAKAEFCEASVGEPVAAPKPVAKRIRQSEKPLMNKLESDCLNYLKWCSPNRNYHAQAVTLRLANGLRYSPDFFCFNPPTAVEVKGDWVDGDSFPKLKMAASVYPEIQFLLVWRDKQTKEWKEQWVRP